MLNISVVVCLLGLLVMQACGITIVRCTHSGRFSLAEAHAPEDCGMCEDSECELFFTFKVSDISPEDIQFRSTPLPIWAILPPHILLEGSILTSNYENPALSAFPPGRISHTQFVFRN